MHRILIVFSVLGFVFAGCGGGEEAASPSEDGGGCGCYPDGCGCYVDGGEEEGAGGAGGAYTPDKGTAAVTGAVKLEGSAPKRRPIDMGAEQYCVDYHDEQLRSESYVVGDQGALANVFVYVKDGLGGWKFDPAEGEALLDQHGCMYQPHALGMQVGQTLKVRNSDPIMHNVHAFWMKDNREVFNWAQSKEGLENTMDMRRPGFIFVKCDVHGWMGSHVGVFRNPFYAVTGEDGTFSLDKLPPGTYTVEAWHEKLGTKSESVTVGDGETKEISFSFAR